MKDFRSVSRKIVKFSFNYNCPKAKLYLFTYFLKFSSGYTPLHLTLKGFFPSDCPMNIEYVVSETG